MTDHLLPPHADDRRSREVWSRSVEFAGGLGWVARHPGPWFALVWVPVLLVAPVVDAAMGGQTARVGFLVLLAATSSITVDLPFLRSPSWVRPRHIPELAFVIVLTLCTLYLFAWDVDQEFVFPLLAIVAAVAVRPWWALSVISALTISGGLAAGFDGHSFAAGMTLGFSTFVAGTAVYLVQRLIRLVAELARTQDRLAKAAVAEERLRFSRDLHDLLGHSLSVIVVKAEAIRRLLDIDPEASRAHASDIETIGRTALAEVRAAATGYRSVSLSDELVNARRALRADDIEVDISDTADRVDAHTDSLLGWVVREGTTNVLRHSTATFCRIAVRREGDRMLLEMADNGDPAGVTRSDEDAGSGSGLRGLRERIEQSGGTLTAGRTPSGFQLMASLPQPVRADRA